jgi:hypothetical protein
MGTGKVFRSIEDIRLHFSSFLTVEFNQTAILSLSPLPARRTVPVVGYEFFLKDLSQKNPPQLRGLCLF